MNNVLRILKTKGFKAEERKPEQTITINYVKPESEK